jgi:hypothetical protein
MRACPSLSRPKASHPIRRTAGATARPRQKHVCLLRMGTLESEMRRPRALEDRLNVLRALRTRPIRDLGPRDAETLAREALASPSTAGAEHRAGGDCGRVRARAERSCSGAGGTPCVRSSIGGSADGGRRSLGPRRREAPTLPCASASALLVVDLLTGLLPSDRHSLDSASRELALTASATARALGGSSPAELTPEAAMHAWAVARTSEAQRTVPPEVLAQALNRPAALRQGTRGRSPTVRGRPDARARGGCCDARRAGSSTADRGERRARSSARRASSGPRCLCADRRQCPRHGGTRCDLTRRRRR